MVWKCMHYMNSYIDHSIVRILTHWKVYEGKRDNSRWPQSVIHYIREALKCVNLAEIKKQVLILFHIKFRQNPLCNILFKVKSLWYFQYAYYVTVFLYLAFLSVQNSPDYITLKHIKSNLKTFDDIYHEF